MINRLFLALLIVVIPFLLYSQDWIGIGSGTSHMIIKGNKVYTDTDGFILKEDGFNGEINCSAQDPDTGEEHYPLIMEVYNNGDSVKLKSLKGHIYNTYYRGNKFKRKRPFKFQSICLEIYDAYRLKKRYEINIYGRYEYNDYDNDERIVKQINNEMIDSFKIYTEYLDIESISKSSFGWASVTGHCCDQSISFTDKNNRNKYQHINQRTPYHFKPIYRLLKRLKNEE